MTTGQHGLSYHKSTQETHDEFQARKLHEKELRSLDEYKRKQDKKEAARELNTLNEKLESMPDGGDIAKHSLPGVIDSFEHSKTLSDNEILRERGMSPIDVPALELVRAERKAAEELALRKHVTECSLPKPTGKNMRPQEVISNQAHTELYEFDKARDADIDDPPLHDYQERMLQHIAYCEAVARELEEIKAMLKDIAGSVKTIRLNIGLDYE